VQEVLLRLRDDQTRNSILVSHRIWAKRHKEPNVSRRCVGTRSFDPEHASRDQLPASQLLFVQSRLKGQRKSSNRVVTVEPIKGLRPAIFNLASFVSFRQREKAVYE